MLMFARLARRLTPSLSVIAALSGCGVYDRDSLFLRPAQYEARNPLQPAPLSKAWVSTPEARSLYMRPIYDGWEQRINLINTTTVAGDNQMILRMRREGSSSGRLVFEEFVKWAGGLPAPFTELTSGDLIRGEDSIGPYFYAEYRTGADTICIYAMRRITSGTRQMPVPVGTVYGGVMDVQMRNCGRGTPESALTPILDESLGNSALARLPDGSSRMLSALAGPSQP